MLTQIEAAKKRIIFTKQKQRAKTIHHGYIKGLTKCVNNGETVKKVYNVNGFKTPQIVKGDNFIMWEPKEVNTVSAAIEYGPKENKQLSDTLIFNVKRIEASNKVDIFL